MASQGRSPWLGSDGAQLDFGTRCARPQPQEHRRRHPPPPAGGDHGPVRVRQIVARLRHHLRGGPASLRRVALGLRAPVPRADGEAGRRSDRRTVSGHLDRAEDDRREPEVHGRNRHRDLRLPPAALRQYRRPALPELWQGDRQPVAGAHRRHGDAVPAGRPDQRPGAHRPGPQGRVQEGACGPAWARLHQGANRRAIPIAGATTPSRSWSIG
jgi:hypothetical protein